MSLDALNQIIGEAIINKSFREALLTNPMGAVTGFDLAVEELDLIATIRARSLDHFARQLMAALSIEDDEGVESVFGRNGHGRRNGYTPRNGHGPEHDESALTQTLASRMTNKPGSNGHARVTGLSTWQEEGAEVILEADSPTLSVTPPRRRVSNNI